MIDEPVTEDQVGDLVKSFEKKTISGRTRSQPKIQRIRPNLTLVNGGTISGRFYHDSPNFTDGPSYKK